MESTLAGVARVLFSDTKAAAVTQALREFIARRRQKSMLELAGKLEWHPGYDYKKERSRG